MAEFPAKLYREVASGNGNLFFSPYSISSAMSMLLLGCRGKSGKELMDLFQGDESLHEANSEIQKALMENLEGMELTTANRIFVRQGCKLLQQFLDDCAKYYASEAKALDFAGDSAGSRKHINEWVEKQTKEKIKNLIPSGVINSLTRVVLVNAIYFKSKWESEFQKSDTIKHDFHVSESKRIKVDMMSQKSWLRFSKDDKLGAKMLELDYKGEKVSMVVVLPLKKFGLTEVEKKFNGKHLTLTYSTVKVKVPKFKMEYRYGLVEVFKSLGVKSIFSGDADLSGITDKDLYVSDIIHKAFVEVNEEGTEAAAATAVVVEEFYDGDFFEEKEEEFICDHPFLFLIVYKPTNTILFMGRFTGPDN